jgi:hypothetical protein
LLIESDFPVDATTRGRNGESRRRKPYESLILDALTSSIVVIAQACTNFQWLSDQITAMTQDLRSLPSICERKIKSLAIPYEPLIQVERTQSTFHLHAQRTVFHRRDARQQSRSFVRENLSLQRSPNSNRLCSDCQR